MRNHVSKHMFANPPPSHLSIAGYSVSPVYCRVFGITCLLPGIRYHLSIAGYSVSPGLLLPERPGQPDCSFFMRTGAYFPISTLNLAQERPGQPDCSFFMRTGACKFGEKCKFNHPPSVGLKM
jgi:hypothetical protein